MDINAGSVTQNAVGTNVSEAQYLWWIDAGRVWSEKSKNETPDVEGDTPPDSIQSSASTLAA